MEKQSYETEAKKFSSPEEEIAFLRDKIAEKQAEMEKKGGEVEIEKVAKEVIGDYKTIPASQVLDSSYHVKPKEQGEIILDLSPEPHDKKMNGLIVLLQTRGVKNALSVVDGMRNPHIDDDFHRFLVQYVRAGLPVRGLSEGGPLWKPTHMLLLEISLPEISKEEGEKELKKLISCMEQFYAGMISVSSERDKRAGYFSLEIANANGSEEFVFYAGVPEEKRDLFEKQIHSLFPGAKIKDEKNDYNIFNDAGESVGSVAVSGRNPIFSMKTYEDFDVDPLNVILNSFSKIDKWGEGAAVQFVFKPAQDLYIHKYRKALNDIKEGASVKDSIDIPDSFMGGIFKALKHLVKGEAKRMKTVDGREEPPKVDDNVVEMIEKKLTSPIFEVNVRIIASSSDKKGAEEILADLEASFNQFNEARGNRLSFTRLKGGKLRQLLHRFSWRIFSDSERLPLSVKELTTMMHFPSSHIKTSPQLKQARAGTAPAPMDLPTAGVLLGINKDRGGESKVYMMPEDRLRHFYVIGQTGTGKTTLLKNMIAQDILAGKGVCMIDPHGVDIQDILANVPKERYEDVIYFDPSYTDRPMALNMLEYDERFPEQKTFVVNEMLSIFNKLFDMKTAGGPMFEQYFRNAVLLAIDEPGSGSTLFDVSRLLANKAFRESMLARCKNPIVTQFWREVAEKAGGEASLQNIVPYVTSKFDNFLANDIMRPIVSQSKSSFNFREVMDNRKILLVNLAKGRLGDLNSSLIGLILVGKILMAALSRVDSFGKELPEFYLYIDEFQNVTTDSISTILSEARKYRLGLNIAHQFIGQLSDDIKNAVFGNVGTMATFRVGSEDAEFLEKQFEPVFTARDIINLDNRHAYLRLLMNGRPVKPFNIETLPPPVGNRGNIEKLKELSHLKFGRPRAEVEQEIMSRYQV